MSDNKLLTENTIRRFMQLANVDALADNFIQEAGMGAAYKKKVADDDKTQEEAYSSEEEVLEEEEEDEELEMDADLGDDLEDAPEPDMDMPGDPEADAPGAADMSLTEEEAQVLIELGERLKAAMGGMEADLGDEEEDMPIDDEEEDMPIGDEEEEEDIPMQEHKDAIVAEVLKRVTKRILNNRSGK